ncbi:AmiS/UreI family transporter [Helicobacter mustelae]|uniref:Putative Urease accessory protein UreI n=1 Tax=Helicobacter mustelae (strain ATCC 43772 / CCUG 25715 / CIP 103759 / LMG 18044 / NCTC 12198 / R85-136P) TaxID=679897 RepID=D3UGE8_HELM1|nr:AmiS/UreI family transporter [Helicobacter mustelae]CBG39569.1 putative Urease accessory protein UreI [Helicobacter mustelae 12198]SQH71081.1 Urease accessory protein UreI [Helicobacter mustelae]STP12210.1 Urease accessory protein UreI [Helicobacter mustelae]
MLGIVLLYVAIVLISNGICRISNCDAKSAAVMNIFVGGLSLILNIVVIIHGEDFDGNGSADFYAAGTGLLFGFTYLFVALNNLLKLDLRPYGWYSLFVAINSIPAAYYSYITGTEEGAWFALIWLAWGVLWLTGFIETVLKIELKFVPYLAILEGILTAWIPAWLIFRGYWS